MGMSELILFVSLGIYFYRAFREVEWPNK